MRRLNSSAEMISSEVSSSQEECPGGLPSQASASFDALRGAGLILRRLTRRPRRGQTSSSCFISKDADETSYYRSNPPESEQHLQRASAASSAESR